MADKNPGYEIDAIRSFLNRQPNDKVAGYRKGETTPIRTLSVADVIAMAQASQFASNIGMPTVGKDQLVNKMLVEGRADAGTNSVDYTNKPAQELLKKMHEAGFSGKAAMYPAAVLEKSIVAGRLGKDFEEIWNGVGTSADTGRTGKQHAVRVAEHSEAKDDPRNATLVDLVKRARTGELTDIEKLVSAPYQQDLALYERYGLPTPKDPEDYTIPFDKRKANNNDFDSIISEMGVGYSSWYPINISGEGRRTLATLLEAKDRKSKGEDSAITRWYEQKMMENPILASAVGTIAAKTTPKEVEPAPSSVSMLDRILQYFR